jgi:hypothetical protein
VGGFERGKCSRKKSGGITKVLMQNALQRSVPKIEPGIETPDKSDCLCEEAAFKPLHYFNYTLLGRRQAARRSSTGWVADACIGARDPGLVV